MSKKGLERRIAEEESYVPRDTKKLDELGLKYDQVLRDIEEMKRQHEHLNKLGITNKIHSKNIVIRYKELDKLRKEGLNVVRV